MLRGCTLVENYKLPPLHNFRNISSLLVSCHSDIPIAYCTREIITAIAASPKFTRFSLRNLDGADHNIAVAKTCTSLQTFFGNATSLQLNVDTAGAGACTSSRRRPEPNAFEQTQISHHIHTDRLSSSRFCLGRTIHYPRRNGYKIISTLCNRHGG